MLMKIIGVLEELEASLRNRASDLYNARVVVQNLLNSKLIKNQPPIMNLSSSLNLVSESPLERQELRKLKKIINYLLQNADSQPFREPVDWEGLQLLDYTKIIKKPMDLGTVVAKLQGEEYRFIEEVLDDLQLIWDNCKTYNQNGSWVYSMADRMEKYYRKLIKNYFTSIPITLPPKPAEPHESSQTHRNTRVSARKIEKHDSRIEDDSSQLSEGKRRLLAKLKRLVDLITSECQQAFSLKDDRCSIYIDKISDDLWKEIREKLAEFQEVQDRVTKKVKL